METALGFGWLVWRRSRIACAFALGSIGVTFAIAQSPFAPYALAFGGVYFGLALLSLLLTVSFADGGDLSVAHSGYPGYLLLLPLRSATLAAWPMVLGSAALVAAWAAFAAITLTPRFGPVTIIVPGLGLVALLTTLQAISWSSFSVPILRSATALVVIGLIGAWGRLIWDETVSPLIGGLGFALATIVAFAVATRGIAQARRGDVTAINWSRSKPAGPQPPFRSPMEAQVWFESRGNGRALPLLSGSAALLFALPTVLSHLRPLTVNGDFAYDQALPLYFVAPALIVAFSGFDGCCANIRDNLREDLTLAFLLATRPISDAGLIEAKLRMAVRAVLRSGAVLAIGPALCLLSPLQVGGNPTTVGAYLIGHATARDLGLIVLIAVLSLLIMWRNAVSSIWLRLAPQGWIRYGIGVGFPLMWMSVGLTYGLRVLNDPSLLSGMTRWIFPALGMLAVVKVVAAVIVARANLTRKLITLPVICRWTGVALAAGTAVMVAAECLAAAIPLSRLEFGLAIFLFLPLVRVQLAVLTLSDNRHRAGTT